MSTELIEPKPFRLPTGNTWFTTNHPVSPSFKLHGRKWDAFLSVVTLLGDCDECDGIVAEPANIRSFMRQHEEFMDMTDFARRDKLALTMTPDLRRAIKANIQSLRKGLNAKGFSNRHLSVRDVFTLAYQFLPKGPATFIRLSALYYHLHRRGDA